MQKPLQSSVTWYSSSQVHSEQNRLVWLHAEWSMLIFALWRPMTACVYLLGYKGTCVLESTKWVLRSMWLSCNLWTQQMPHSHCCLVSRCLLLCSFNWLLWDWSWGSGDRFGVKDSSGHNGHSKEPLYSTSSWTSQSCDPRLACHRGPFKSLPFLWQSQRNISAGQLLKFYFSVMILAQTLAVVMPKPCTNKLEDTLKTWQPAVHLSTLEIIWLSVRSMPRAGSVFANRQICSILNEFEPAQRTRWSSSCSCKYYIKILLFAF